MMHLPKSPLAVSQQEKFTLRPHSPIQALIILSMAILICACQSVPAVQQTSPQPHITSQPQHTASEATSPQHTQNTITTIDSTNTNEQSPNSHTTTTIEDDKIGTAPKDYVTPSHTPETKSPTPSSSSLDTNNPDPSILTQPTPNVSEQPPSTSIEAQTTDTPTAPVVIVTIPKPDPETTRQILLERARENSQNNTGHTRILNTGDNLPAFRQLMDIGVSQLQANQLNAAENSFTRAQRLAPQSSAVYFYLGQVALKKNQPRKAEAMARRGLIVAQSPERRRALWQIILRSGQQQNNPRVIQEAQNALR
ncbi:tetratricopeptide repeat protein [Psychrobacter sp. I-STPA6b]|uniref:tetratricopeptide repeat protein n=1 Tax=Psychrobacter sp. I-STPA6b TaxID=2585718 RepID=UPI001D0CBC54|nr:tetratricopeptide repeat protein [Psychrobacter sp. I-STPA6b]